MSQWIERGPACKTRPEVLIICSHLLDVFKPDPKFAENEARYADIKNEILGSSDDEDGSEGSDDESDEEDDQAAPELEGIQDMTETDLINLRRTIYLTLMNSLGFEEAVHKLMKIEVPEGKEIEMCNMIIECCSQERSYTQFYGLIAERFCKLNRIWRDAFQEAFGNYYETIHRYETNKLRNIGRLFGHLLASDAISWAVLHVVHMNEEETTSSSRILIKILMQEIQEEIGMKKMVAIFKDEDLKPALAGIFPTDNPKNTRFSINYFTSIGLGAVTEDMRTWLQVSLIEPYLLETMETEISLWWKPSTRTLPNFSWLNVKLNWKPNPRTATRLPTVIPHPIPTRLPISRPVRPRAIPREDVDHPPMTAGTVGTTEDVDRLRMTDGIQESKGTGPLRMTVRNQGTDHPHLTAVIARTAGPGLPRMTVATAGNVGTDRLRTMIVTDGTADDKDQIRGKLPACSLFSLYPCTRVRIINPCHPPPVKVVQPLIQGIVTVLRQVQGSAHCSQITLCTSNRNQNLPAPGPRILILRELEREELNDRLAPSALRGNVAALGFMGDRIDGRPIEFAFAPVD